MEKGISVVIPTFKRTGLLIRCLNALAEQTFPMQMFEIIVVSDGPDMDTAEAIEKWKAPENPQITFLSLPYQKGPAAARNRGWLQAKGDLIAFTDDDCIPQKLWLKSFWSAYDGHEDIVLSGKVIVPLPEHPTDFQKNTAYLETAEFITANCACTKSVLLKTGGFDERFEMAWREDSDLHFKILLSEIPLFKVAGAVVVHPAREAPWGVSIKEQKKGIYNALLYKKYPELYKTKIRSKAPLNYYIMIICFAVAAAGLIQKSTLVFIAGFLFWLLLLTFFAIRRLRFTSLHPSHVLEMFCTSMIIPFASVYWQLYGAWKYRVLFI